ncbi:MAG: GreA/GreB family elongation factor [Gammaproteobacteria bacterium]|nr:GreA/GreB family elongation factor [Gammaproteobacteria bacterium]
MPSVHAGAASGASGAPGDFQERLPELPVSPHDNFVTARGLGQLQARLADAQFRLAQLDADAGLEREYLERHVRWLRSRLDSAIPVNPRDAARDKVGFGATVEVLEEDDRRSRYRIVGEDEADPDRGLLSWVSPLAHALMGARVGDHVSWRRADGNANVEVTEIDFGHEAPGS